MRWLGLDIGSKTIGMAVSDEGEVVALPLRTLKRNGGKKDLDAITNVVNEINATGLVLGLPLDLDGNEKDAARRVRTLGESLKQHLGFDINYWDERFSTVAAQRTLLEADLSRKRRKQVIDHVAAAIILQGFLDSRAAKKEQS